MTGRSRNLKRHLLFWLFLITAASFILSGVFMLERSHSALIKATNKLLQAYVQTLINFTEITPEGAVELDFIEEATNNSGSFRSGTFFLILDAADGAELKRSKSLENAKVTLPVPAQEVLHDKPLFWVADLDNHNVRFIALRASHKEEDIGMVAFPKECLFLVGVDTRDDAGKFWDIVERTLIAQVLGLAALLLSSWYIVSRSLKPLEKLQREVQAITPSNLVTVSVPEIQEIAGVVLTLNKVIEHIKEVFERERRFTADVAHELRTPISEIRALTEVALKYGDNLDEQDKKNYADTLSSTIQMQNIVATLLMLARCDVSALKCQKDTFALDALASEVWKQFASKASAKSIVTRFDIESGLLICTDKQLLRIILENLFSNAVEYTPPGGGVVEISAGLKNEEFFLSVSNSVEDISGNDVSHMFERFWRKDSARSSVEGHVGLGLSLVKEFAGILGCAVAAELSDRQRLTITLSCTRAKIVE